MSGMQRGVVALQFAQRVRIDMGASAMSSFQQEDVAYPWTAESSSSRSSLVFTALRLSLQ
ncbi:hypothetical protein BH18ACI4_BH18ACI4_29710 [soil metagenome]